MSGANLWVTAGVPISGRIENQLKIESRGKGRKASSRERDTNRDRRKKTENCIGNVTKARFDARNVFHGIIGCGYSQEEEGNRTS
uniref:Uncharacterized protein n=1 Tax=Heterorhabditis bacteriophora TaxID=37862 RepID=A0A1I7WNZ9_HETBA